MRVVAGTARSLPLKSPAGQDTRPTQDRIKETLFNIIQFQVPGCVFIDAFSGSGSIGIEALSRGAGKAYFIENAPKAVCCIEENLKFTKFTDRAIVLRQDVYAALSGIREKEADIIFLDPPYRQGHEFRALSLLRGMKYVTASTLVIVEASLDTDFDDLEDLGFTLEREKKYKTNKHVFIRRQVPGA